MNDFLTGALSAAKADLTSKRASGTAYGRPNKDLLTQKKSKWASNRGSKERAKDEGKHSGSGLSAYDLERSRKALERKEREYNRMFNKGTDMALTGDAADNLLIDFDRKWAEGHRQDESSSEGAGGVDDRASDDEEDPFIEVQDEFGRTRRIRKSEALMHERPVLVNARPENLIYGPHLQRFDPDEQKKDAIWAEEEASKEVHYNPDFEVRQKGAGYINLGRGKEREARMTELSKARTETIEVRKTHGLGDTSPPTPILQETVPPGDARAVEDYVHPSRKRHVSLAEPKISEEVEDAARDRKRTRAGEAFLDTLM